jgi:hypothetical protein
VSRSLPPPLSPPLLGTVRVTRARACVS